MKMKILTKIGWFIADEDVLGWLSIFLEDAARYNENEELFEVAKLARSVSDTMHEAIEEGNHDN
jgi:hypothetical protein